MYFLISKNLKIKFKLNILTILFLTIYNLCFYSQTNDTIRNKNSINQDFNEIIVTASRISEFYLKSSINIEKIRYNDLNGSTSMSVFEHLENTKAVHLITPSLGFKIINSGGFANTTNVRFTQLIDGIDNQAPHIGSPIANALGACDLDIQEIEFISGSASALYGMNSINGLINFKTKSPFKYKGISFQTLNGINHLGNIDKFSPSIFNQTHLRYAIPFNDKWAFKFNFSANKGTDWVADNRDDLAFDKNSSLGLLGYDNPAYDEVNSYGNESSNRKTLNLDGKKIVVARTGYRESSIDDYDMQNNKFDISLHFKPNQKSEFIACYKGALINNIYQRSNRFRLKNYLLQQFSLSYSSPIIEFKSYLTQENTGKSYNIRSLAENMDRAFKSDDKWFADFSNNFNEAINNGESLNNALKTARNKTDYGRFIPNTKEFNTIKNDLININNWDYGAALRVISYLSHIETVVNWHNLFPNLKYKFNIELLSSFDLRSYIIIPDGNYFINPSDSNSNLIYKKFGGFTQINKSILNKKIKLSLTLRTDKADYFNWKINPRISAVYSKNNKFILRVSAQSGYRYPSIFEGFSNVNSGNVKRVGGLKIMSDGIFEKSYTKNSIDEFQSTVIKDINVNGISQNEAIEKNKYILKKNPYTYLKPESIKSFELGFRSLIFNEKLYIDFNLYYNIYENFIAQVEASIPKTEINDSIPYYLFNKSKQDRYRLWTNSKSKIFTYGSNILLRYKLNNIFTFNTNFNFSKLDRTENQDGLEDGYNTPKLIINSGISLDNFWKKFSSSLTVKYQSKYEYVSFLISGTVPQFWTLDAQINYSFTKYGLNLKIGANNLLNKTYYSILGGPNIGGIYYLTLLFQQK